MKTILSKRSVLFYTPLLVFITVVMMTTMVSADLISANGNVTLISGSEYFSVSNASDGNPTSTWVTEAPCGGDGDYFNCAGAPTPVMVFDLGSDIAMDSIAFWNYSSGNANNVTEFSLRFASEADGADNIGTSIGYNPTFTTDVPGNETQVDFVLDTIIVARYVELTATDNMYGGALPGGDRAGFGDIQFNEVSPGKAWNPWPAYDAEDIGRNITLQWNAARDPNSGSIEDSLLEHVVYLSNGEPADANVIEIGRVTAGDPILEQLEYGPLNLEFGKTYYWRVDEITDSNTITGDLWRFQTTPAEPLITGQSGSLLVFEGEDVSFTVTVTNPYSQDNQGLQYEWFMVDAGGDIPVGDDSPEYNISGVTADDEGQYYCKVTIVDPAVGTVSQSDTVSLVIKQLIGYWPFESDLSNMIDDNAGTYTGQGDPPYVAGIMGDTMAIEFPAGGSYITVPTDAHTNTSWTLSWWEKSSPEPSQEWETMIGCATPNDPEDTDGWGLFEFGRHQASGYAFGILNDYQYAASDGTYPREQWHFHVFTYDASTKTGQWYINASKVNDYNNLYFTEFDSVLSVGNVKGLSQPYTGAIDELKLYNYPLDPFVIAGEYSDVTGEIICVEYPQTDVTGPEGVPDCKVDILDLAEILSTWLAHGYFPDRP